MMERVAFEGGVDLSRIVYGMWRLADDPDRSAAHVRAKIEACLEQGITSFDQADIYGDYGSEELLGSCLKESPQLADRMEIVTKCDIMLMSARHPGRRVKYYDSSRAHLESSVENSLRLMNIERIDMLLIHRPDPLMNHQETGAALDALVAAGKVRAVGVSNFKPHDWSLLQSAMSTPLATNQIELGLLAPQGFTNGDVAHSQQAGRPIMAWSPLGGGMLFAEQNAALRGALRDFGNSQGVDETAAAIAWLLRHPAKILPVLGTNTLDRIAKLSDALKVEMDRESWFELYTKAIGAEVP